MAGDVPPLLPHPTQPHLRPLSSSSGCIRSKEASSEMAGAGVGAGAAELAGSVVTPPPLSPPPPPAVVPISPRLVLLRAELLY